MAKFKFTPYNRLNLLDSRGLVFKCENEEEYRINYRLQFSGPGVIKRKGERLIWTLFFGGIPRYMQEWEIIDRRDTTLKRMVNHQETILEEIISYVEKAAQEEVDMIIDKEHEEKSKARIEEALYDPQTFGLAEHLLRPEVGMRLAAGVIISNPTVKDENLKRRLRIAISKTPIAEIYCLPPQDPK